MDRSGEKRYLRVKFHAKSLEGNPLGSPVDRELAVYLPPKYYDDESLRYPVIYYLHGYGAQPQRLSALEDVETFLGGKGIVKTLKKVLGVGLDDFPSYRKFDQLILEGEMEPLIFVQPDACLHLKTIHDLSALGPYFDQMRKGSFYVNSPHTGNYEDYIIKDVINYIDSNFRTIPNRFNRGMVGVSMGAIGAINLSAKHPDKLIAASALSGAPQFIISEYDFLMQLQNPPNLISGYAKLGLSQNVIRDYMKKFWKDVTDTLDLLCSPNEQRLTPTIKEGRDGTITFDRSAFETYKQNYKKYFVEYTRNHLEAFKEVHLQLKCHAYDPLAPTVEIFHEFLELFKIPHEYELYIGKKYELSPHVFGCIFELIPAIQFCLKHFQQK